MFDSRSSSCLGVGWLHLVGRFIRWEMEFASGGVLCFQVSIL